MKSRAPHSFESGLLYCWMATAEHRATAERLVLDRAHYKRRIGKDVVHTLNDKMLFNFKAESGNTVCDNRGWAFISTGFWHKTQAQHSTAEVTGDEGEDALCGADIPDDAVT